MIRDPNRLLPGLEWRTRDALEQMASLFRKATHLDIRVRSGTRSCAQQNALYAQGRTAPGPIVTYARGCHSWHVLGRAFDADPVNPDGSMSSAPSDYAILGEIWKRLGGDWGGDFTQLDDAGHFEFHPFQDIEDVCPEPEACSDAAVDTEGPIWPWAVLAACTVGAAAWVLIPDR